MQNRLFTSLGLKAVWSLLMDDASIAWFMRLGLDDAQCRRIMMLFADVWWHYLQTKVKGDCKDMKCALVLLEALFCLEEKESNRFAERFAALLFQLVVQEHHDQSLFSVTVEYDRANHYFQRVDRSKNGVVVSNNVLMDYEDHPLAQETVERARRPLGRLVSLVLSSNEQEFVRLRKAPKVFRCSKHAKSTINGMNNCSGCHRLHEGKLHFFDPFCGDYRPRDDFFTTLDSGAFKPAEELEKGDPLLFHTEGKLCHKVIKNVEVSETHVTARCGGAYQKVFQRGAQAYTCTFDKVVESVRLLKTEIPGKRLVLDTMRLSKPFKTTMRHRWRRKKPDYEWRYYNIPPMHFKSRRFWEYVVYQWCKQFYFSTTNYVADKKRNKQREREFAIKDYFKNRIRVATQAVCLV